MANPVLIKIWDVATGRRFWHIPTDLTRFVCGWLAAILAVVTITFIVNTGLDASSVATVKTTAGRLLVAWTALPPMFFWFDYFVLWNIEERDNVPGHLSFEAFKHGQEVSRNLWLALVALLAAFYFHGAS